MSRERLFLDTAFIQALLNPRDDYHQQAKQLLTHPLAFHWVRCSLRSRNRDSVHARFYLIPSGKPQNP